MMTSGIHAGILEPVHGAEGNVGGLVFMVQEHLVANGDLGRPFDHHPVLCPVVVLLERKLPARFDDDALHLKTLTSRQRFVTPPRR